jgi:NAD(P)-dependent dehydrogenase (short-subunit alcohol dehydrogenase family)
MIMTTSAAQFRPRDRMAGRICLVTGGGTGIGRAAALLMAQEGAAAVVIAGRREAEGQAAADDCGRFGAKTLFVRTDVTEEAEVAGLVKSVMDRFGRLDVAFNNAGHQERRAPIEQQTEAVYDTVFDANVRSVFLGLKHQIQAMELNGGGRIVINASVSGIRNPNPGLALYSASKAAVISLMRSAAMECGPRGIRINAVAPGRVVTDMMLASGIADMSAVAAGLPIRRMGQPHEVAEAVVWLASDDAGYIVGHVLSADGGFSAT